MLILTDSDFRPLSASKKAFLTSVDNQVKQSFWPLQVYNGLYYWFKLRKVFLIWHRVGISCLVDYLCWFGWLGLVEWQRARSMTQFVYILVISLNSWLICALFDKNKVSFHHCALFCHQLWLITHLPPPPLLNSHHHHHLHQAVAAQHHPPPAEFDKLGGATAISMGWISMTRLFGFWK